MVNDYRFQAYESGMAGEIVALWQRAIGDAYPLSERLFRQVIEGNPGGRPSDATTVWDGSELIGFGSLHRYREDHPWADAFRDLAWLTLVLVDPERQRRGIGTRICHHLREGVADLPDDRLRAGSGLHHFFPGPPADLPAVRPFLESLGFSFDGEVVDVRVDVTDFQLPTSAEAALAKHDLTVIPCPPEEWDRLLAFLLAEFGAGWRYRAGWFRERGGDPADLLLLRRADEIVGFAQTHYPDSAVIGPASYWNALRGPSPGGFGPIGVAGSLRGHGLGLALLQVTLDHLRARGVADVSADWTNLIDFYAKVGMRPWKRYAVGG
ncbi:MAG: GNAT family N-acetyltransferase [Thermomicrobiales bacterium]